MVTISLNDEDAFLDSINSMISDRAGAEAIGRDNRTTVESFYIEECARQYEEILEDAVRTSRK